MAAVGDALIEKRGDGEAEDRDVLQLFLGTARAKPPRWRLKLCLCLRQLDIPGGGCYKHN